MSVAAVVCASSAAEAQDRPPELIEMAPVARPPGEDADAIEIVIVIEPSGEASVEECDAAPATCDVIREAIAAATFRPAEREGAPVRGRVRFSVVFAPSPTETETEDGEPAPRGDEPAVAPAEDGEPEAEDPSPRDEPDQPALGVTAEIVRVEEGARRLTLEEARDTPGALGDPFRALLTMPGVVPVAEGLPYFYLRGAPPSGTVYYYDGIPLPALYHFAFGPAVVHPRMLGAIQITNGIAPARYGRHSGGVVVGEGPEPPDRLRGEAEIRLLDVSGYGQGREGDLTVAIGARYGYPGLLASLFAPGVELQYADYQARATLAVGGGSRLELVWLGSYDLFVFTNEGVGTAGPTSTRFTMTFQRGELRWVHERARTQIGAALRFGHDESSFANSLADTGASGLGLSLVSFGSRFWITHREGPLELRAGGDLYGARGSLFDTITEGAMTPLGEIAGITGTMQRTTSGLYAEVDWRPWRWLRVIGGVRGDLYVTPGRYEAAIDPRLRLVWEPDPALSVHAAVGVARQPAVFSFPLPGLSELPLSNGLQTATQSEVGAAVRAREGEFGVNIDGRLFLHRYENMLFADLLADVGLGCTAGGLCRALQVSPRVNSTAAGAELAVRADLGPHFRARFAYTLTFLDSDGLGPVDYTPTHDVRHVWNLVLAYDSRSGFSAGLRGFLRSGTVQGFNYVTGDELAFGRYEQRLPWYGRVDAMLAYGWNAGWARLRFSVDWINVLFALGGEPQGLQCSDRSGPPEEPCPTAAVPGFPLPSIGLRGTFE